MLDWVHGATDVPEAGRPFTRVATATERGAVATELGLLACRALEANYSVRPEAGGRYRVEGRVRAVVEQACVVTLEPVEAAVDEPFEVTFCPAEAMPAAPSSEREILSEPEIEPLRDGRIEVGRVVFETLAAALEPYPRRADAAFEWTDPRDAGGSEKASPFAVLRSLKRDT